VVSLAYSDGGVWVFIVIGLLGMGSSTIDQDPNLGPGDLAAIRREKAFRLRPAVYTRMLPATRGVSRRRSADEQVAFVFHGLRCARRDIGGVAVPAVLLSVAYWRGKSPKATTIIFAPTANRVLVVARIGFGRSANVQLERARSRLAARLLISSVVGCCSAARGGVATDRNGDRCTDPDQRRIPNSANPVEQPAPLQQLQVVKVHSRVHPDAVVAADRHLGTQPPHRRGDRTYDHRMQQSAEWVTGKHDHWAPLVEFGEPDLAAPRLRKAHHRALSA
jgi:hypothetical protein